jgi:hypothetical protein
MTRPRRVPLDPDLYADVVEEAKHRFAVWPSAYASGWVVQQYLARGGEYAGEARSRDTGLTKWFDEEWVDLSRPIYDEDGDVVGYEPCGREESSQRAYPKCRPIREALRMTPDQVADAIERKRRVERQIEPTTSRSRAPARVATYRQNPTVDDLPVVDVERWDDGTVVEWIAVPFPYERKPLRYRDDPVSFGNVVPLAALIATQRKVTAEGVRRAKATPITVLETHDGRLYVADGHHRAVAAWLRGDDVIEAEIVQVRE